jgi:hypothetical protein
MQPLVQLLQAVLGPVWGSAPSLWRKAAAAGKAAAAAGGTAGTAAGVTAGRQRGHRAGSSGSGTTAAGQDARQAGRVRPLGGVADPSMVQNPGAGLRALAQLLVPAHGLQVASHTRSLPRGMGAADISKEQVDLVTKHQPACRGCMQKAVAIRWHLRSTALQRGGLPHVRRAVQ